MLNLDIAQVGRFCDDRRTFYVQANPILCSNPSSPEVRLTFFRIQQQNTYSSSGSTVRGVFFACWMDDFSQRRLTEHSYTWRSPICLGVQFCLWYSDILPHPQTHMRCNQSSGQPRETIFTCSTNHAWWYVVHCMIIVTIHIDVEIYREPPLPVSIFGWIICLLAL